MNSDTPNMLCAPKKSLAHYQDSLQVHWALSSGFQTILGGLDFSPGICNLGCIDLFLPASYNADGCVF